MTRNNNRGRLQTTLTSTTEANIVSASSLNFCHDLFGLIASNTSASAVSMAIYDGGSTTGIRIAVINIPAGDTRGFMLPSDDGLKQTTKNTSWTAVLSATANVEVTTMYTRRPVAG